jgi:hypothetical protein
LPAESSPKAASRIPLALKVIYTAFVAVLVPYYWHAYGPENQGRELPRAADPF